MKILSSVSNFFKKHRALRIISKIILAILIFVIACVALTFGGLQVACRPSSVTTINQVPSLISADNTRVQVSTYLTYPEWFIVYSSDEYAQFLAKNPPSQFPYFGSIRQYWSNYCKVYEITKARNEFSAGDHLMLFVIGWSYSAELGIKGVYENTVGRITEQFGNYPATSEDAYADKVAKDYVDFIRLRPWYEYNFVHAFGHLWTDNSFFGPYFVRKFERRMFLSAEYGTKTIYGWLIGLGSHAVYGVDSIETHVVANNVPNSVFKDYPQIKKVQQLGPNSYVLSIPRYQPFTDLVPELAAQGVSFSDVAGNKEIFLTVLLPVNSQFKPGSGEVLFETKILTNPSEQRVGLSVPVESLSQIITQVQNKGGVIEHLYDY